MAMPSRKEFLNHVADVIARRFPRIAVERNDGDFAMRLNGFWASMENLYRTVAGEPDKVDERVEDWVREMMKAAEGLPDDEEASSFERLRKRILPMVMADTLPEAAQSSILRQQLITGLAVAYAIDSERSITYVPPKLFERWNVPLDDVHEAALDNLVARSETLAAQAAQDEDGRVNMIIVQTMDGYDASRILLRGLHDRLREHLGSPFLAAIPNRDILPCFRNDPETIERVGPQVANDYRTQPHSISDKLFLITADGIAPYIASF